MYAIRSYYDEGKAETHVGSELGGMFVYHSVSHTQRRFAISKSAINGYEGLDDDWIVAVELHRSRDMGADFAPQPIIRITSYNVCYTKLLR